MYLALSFKRTNHFNLFLCKSSLTNLQEDMFYLDFRTYSFKYVVGLK